MLDHSTSFYYIFIKISTLVIQAKFCPVGIFLNILTVADSTQAQFLFEAEVTALNYFPKEGSAVHNYEMPEYLNINPSTHKYHQDSEGLN